MLLTACERPYISMQVIYGDGGVVIVDTGLYNDGYVVYLEGCVSAQQPIHLGLLPRYICIVLAAINDIQINLHTVMSAMKP